MQRPSKPSNQLLSALPRATLAHLGPKLEQRELVYNEPVYEVGQPITRVYFPESGIVSLLSLVDDHSTLEVGIVGREGLVGLPLFLGQKVSQTRAIVQGGGTALSMKAAAFLAECRRSDDLPRQLRRFTHVLLTQISQSAACNRYHQTTPRLARWLLHTHDRMGSDEFRVTHEFLSHMLGARREGVTRAAGELQRAGLISYNRGNIQIHDRAGLERAACDCYGLISGSARR